MLNPDQTAQTYQDGRQQLPSTPPPPPEKGSNSGLLKILLATVVGLVSLIAVGAVILLMSQSNVSTHINRNTSQNTSNSNAKTTYVQPQANTTTVVQPQTTTVYQTTTQPPVGEAQANSSGTIDGFPTNTHDTQGVYDMYSGDSVSGDFARSILSAASNYKNSNGSLPTNVTLTVYSPVTGQSYSVSYYDDGTNTTAYNTTSGGGTNNMVIFPDSLLNG